MCLLMILLKHANSVIHLKIPIWVAVKDALILLFAYNVITLVILITIRRLVFQHVLLINMLIINNFVKTAVLIVLHVLKILIIVQDVKYLIIWLIIIFVYLAMKAVKLVMVLHQVIVSVAIKTNQNF